MKYKVIKTKTQYFDYCQQLEDLVFSQGSADEIDLLTVLIEKWDAEHNTFKDLDPVQLLRSLMTDHHLKARDIVELLGISKGYVSEILNYKKGFSKKIVRKLALRFKVSQEAFNRPYKLRSVPSKGSPTSKRSAAAKPKPKPKPKKRSAA